MFTSLVKSCECLLLLSRVVNVYFSCQAEKPVTLQL